MDIAKKSIFQENQNNILYSFPNNIVFGHLIYFSLRLRREHLLVKIYFSDLTVYFTDQNNNFIDFPESVITLTFDICQVLRTN